jgi:hypothetical protein
VTWILLALVILEGAGITYLYRDTQRTTSGLRHDLDGIIQDAGEFFRSQPKAIVEGEEVVHYLGIATIVLDTNENQCRPGDDRVISVTVSGKYDNPTGEVHLYDNGTASRASRRLENGVAEFKVNFPLRSRHVFSARYSGDGIYEAQGESNSVAVNVI